MIIGLGNPLLRDEGVGIYMLERLAKSSPPATVTLADCGTDMLKMLSFFNRHDLIIFLDAVDGGQTPGTIYHFTKPEILALEGENKAAHQLSAVGSVQLLEKINPDFQKAEVWLIGVQPARIERGDGLTPAVRQAADKVVQEIRERFFLSGAASENHPVR